MPPKKSRSKAPGAVTDTEGPDGSPDDAAAALRATTASPVGDEILRSIRRIIRGVTIHSKKMYRDIGLTMPQYICLKVIGTTESPELTVSQVARHADLSPATVTGILDRLEGHGLVVRERRSKDRRKVCLSITDKGQDKLDNLPSSLQERSVGRINSLAEGERIALLGSLHLLVEMVEASNLDASPILAPGDLQGTKPE